jgi:hypothetical protein
MYSGVVRVYAHHDSMGPIMYGHNIVITHVSNFDWTGCLAGCEERWGPGGREVDGRRVTLWDPSVSAGSVWSVEIYTHTTLCTNYAVWEWV